ncbi:MAG: ABC transporter substrate-binding protein [Alphaproteobacteria bacterium]|nr:ABC transporter substrate-binding protein [Alphaproteobacteria bacterium]
MVGGTVSRRHLGAVLGGLAAVVLAGPLAACAGAQAAELSVGLGADVTSIDPHFHNLSPNSNIAQHIFDTLVRQDERQRLSPGLAESWRPLEDTTWEFKLRKGVKFHDGSDFTAEDVAFTVKRAPNVPNSPSSYGIYLASIAETIVVDPYTVRFKTKGPYPLLPTDISNIFIVSHKAGANATTADYDSGKAAIGTGPFKLVENKKGDRIILARNDGYWGDKPAWDKVTLRLLTNDASRVAALLAGDVQMIEVIPTQDMAKIKANKDLTVSSVVGNRIIYLHVDSARDQSPFVTDKAGKPLDKNPLKDVRVRRAISLAINRQAIVERVMEGEALPAGQLLPDGFFGVSKNLKPDPYDPERAQKLLAEAGYPDGFGITIHGPNNRYINDAKIVQAVAQMLARAGIDAKVDTMPSNVFFSRSSKLEFSLMLVGWGSGTGETSSPLKSLLATFDPSKGFGPSNRGRYSNPKMDAILEKALATVDDAAREKLLAEASEVAIGDLGIIPLHYQINSWAMKKGLTYVARTDEYTLAHEVKPAK